MHREQVKAHGVFGEGRDDEDLEDAAAGEGGEAVAGFGEMMFQVGQVLAVEVALHFGGRPQDASELGQLACGIRFAQGMKLNVWLAEHIGPQDAGALLVRRAGEVARRRR